MTAHELMEFCRLHAVELKIADGKIRCKAPRGGLTPELLEGIKARKEDILAILRAMGGDSQAIARADAADAGVECPASFAQQRLWFLDQFESGGNAFYNIPIGVRMQGTLDVPALEQTLNEVVRRHEALRTTFATLDGVPVQVVAPALALVLPVHDLGGLPAGEREARAQQLAQDEARTPFDLAAGPLIRASLVRLAAHTHMLLFTVHHIVSDGWSVGVLVREVAALYGAFVHGLPSPLPPLNIQYADFARWQRQWLSGEVLDRQLGYWREQLRGIPTLLALPTDRPRPAVQRYTGAKFAFTIDAEAADGLRALARQKQATLFMALAAAFDILLLRYTGQDDLCVGTPIANRNRAETDGLIGFFVNTLVLRTRVDRRHGFLQLLGQVRECALAAYAHQDVPFEHLVEAFNPTRSTSHAPLFQVMLALQNMPLQALELPGMALQVVHADNATSKFDLTLNVIDGRGALAANFEYNTDLFDEATIARMAGHFTGLLRAIVAQPGLPLGELPLLDAEEMSRLLVAWNATDVAHPEVQGIHRMFEEQAARTPDAPALAFQDQRLTYAQLNARANQLAHHLRAQGVGADVLVGLCAGPGPDLVAGLLGILKAGGAYLPLDPSYPQERLAYMLDDARPALVLTQERLANQLPAGARGESRNLFRLDSDWHRVADNPAHDLPHMTLPQHLAYVIYTSGSTGRPKGVLLHHAGLCNLVRAQTAALRIRPGQRVLQFASFNFDASVSEIFMALTAGATLCLAARDDLLPGAGLEDTLRREAIDVATLPPVVLGALSPQHATGLRTIIAAGEACPATLAERWAGGRAFFNAYGPTETTVCATMHLCAADASRPPPVGRPIANTRVYLLDAGMQPVPVGVAGELHIAGEGLARGYLGRPDLTAERFIPDPFGAPGARMYRSGDRARHLPDGSIDCLGRTDTQVKIRGFRVELEEVEAALAGLPNVRQAAVLHREDSPGDQRLVAYVVPALEHQNDTREAEKKQVIDLSHVWDQAYREAPAQGDPQFDVAGWVSSYDRQPIPAGEMREWVDCTVQAIEALRPARVLEIGCGTGLLLHRLARSCRRYCGTDFSAAVLGRLEAGLARAAFVDCRIDLLHCAANATADIDEAFDTVVLNSVVQYFPGRAYLDEVLRGAVDRIDGRGKVFIGDVRHLGLLGAFHASVALHHASPAAPLGQLQGVVAQNVRRESELLLDPGYFTALQRAFAPIGRVEIVPKLAAAANELTRFRYDVVLSIGEDDTPLLDPAWQPWDAFPGGLAAVESLLADGQPDCLAIRAIPDARVEEDVIAEKLLHTLPDARSVHHLRQALAGTARTGVHPAALAALARRHGCEVHLHVAADRPGAFDAVFCRGARRIDWPVADAVETPANQPFSAQLEAAVQDSILGALRRLLPDYMVPGHLMVLDRLPTTPNGKIDRKALPAPDALRSGFGYVAPRNATEELLAGIWAGVLKLDKVGIDDNFFALGGHSLLAVQMVNRIRAALGTEVAVRTLFEAPTVAQLAGRIAQGDRRARAQALVPVSRTLRLPLSYAQQRLWFLQQLEGGSTAFNIPGQWRFKGPLDVAAFDAALQAIVARHEVFRTNFVVGPDGEPELRIAKELRIPMPVVALAPSELAARARAHANHVFDLANEPLLKVELLRLGEQEHVLLMNLHHIVFDGWSMGIMAGEWPRLYAGLRRDPSFALPPLPIQYADYAHWQRNQLHGALIEQQLAYWTRQLDGAPELLNLPTDRMRPAVQRFEGALEEMTLPGELSARIRSLSQQAGASVFMTLLSVFALLMSRYSGEDDILIGTPAANRDRQELEEVIGLFLGTLVLRVDLSGRPAFRELLDRVKKTALDAFAHGDVPFERIVEALPLRRDMSRNPLFQVFFNMLDFPDRSGVQWPGLEVEGLDGLEFDAKFDLTLYVGQTPAGLRLMLLYNTSLFDAQRMQELLRQYALLLEQATARPAAVIDDYTLVTPEARRVLPDAAAPLDAGWIGAVHELFRAQAERRPDAPAVVSHERSWCYRELDDHSERIACCLQDAGVGRGDIVAIHAERNAGVVAAVLGALKTGAAFMMLDPLYPAEHLRACLEAAPPKAWLQVAAQALPPDKAALAAAVPVFLDLVEIEAHPRLPAYAGRRVRPTMLTAGDIAVIAFTSGSTGKPKAVEGRHGPLTHFLPWAQRNFGFTQDERFSMLSGLAHDPLQRDIFTPLCLGGCVCIPHPETIAPHRLGPWMREQAITVANLTPAMGQILAQGAQDQALPALRHIFLVGDVLTRRDVQRLQALAPSAQVVSNYGATETQRAVGCYELRHEAPHDAAREIIPLGRGVPGVQLLVLDRAGRRQAGIGEHGEVYVRSPHLARGYRGDAQATALRFVRSPFSGDTAGDRMYRTGDLGRYLPNGMVECLGRADTQVKLRGFRVELGHIESQLGTHPQVREAVVVIRARNDGDKSLAAYVVPRGEPPTQAQLRAHLAARLPEYMVPAHVVVLQALALTPNGKVDRKALPEPPQAGGGEAAYVAPRTATETLVAGIWAEILKLPRVGVEDDFFALGGHSLMATQIVSKLRASLQVEVPLRALFEVKTVASLAARVDELKAKEDVGRDAQEKAFAEIAGLFAQSGPGAKP
ncbi:non-ribosomal peptide synthetase [Ramlibacter sp.]|uniref:non-ribosomal peptide synthetase n=1 Tax=Ramlibacter sp. TaxID=1917967 RepID=UPI0018290691|nr:non-ribosomal peptide synthetase [Ramlibacter sp.]MBA2672060.1 amino acid adenylation domain-containing protein [Ramlibacter sp.]